MKKLLVIMLSLLMLASLSACSSEQKTEEAERPIKTVSFFDKEYKLPITLEDLSEDGVEPVSGMLDTVKPGENQIVFLSKGDEYIRVYVYNPGTQTLSTTDPSLVIVRIDVQYNDMYMNAKEIPSCKVDGVGIGDKVAAFEEQYGEVTASMQLEEGVVSKYWEWSQDGEKYAVSVVEIAESAYAIEAFLPKK